MARQIFVQKANGASTTPNEAANAFHAGDAGLVGVWSVTAGAYLDANFISSAGAMIPDEFQITQVHGDNTIPSATKIIKKANVSKITVRMADAAGITVATTATDTVSSAANSTSYYYKIIQKSPVGDWRANYEDFVNPLASSASTYDRVGKIWSAEFTTDATATAAELRDGIVAAINALGKDCPMTATSASTANLTVAAPANSGLVFEVVSNVPGVVNATFAPTLSNGSGYVAAAMEKRFGAYQTGITNHLHLPKNVRYADTSKLYDVITFHLDGGTAGLPNNQNFSLNVPGGDEENIVEWWIDSLWVDGSSLFDAIFAGAGAGAVDMDGAASAGTERVLYLRA